MLQRSLMLLSLFASSGLFADEFVIPPENKDEALKAQIESFDSKAQRLLTALEKGAFADVKDFFFPEAAFLQLKAIARPADYYSQLVKWYEQDFTREQARFKGRGPLVFKAIKGGSCKWKAPQTEANRIPYWSCYRRKIELTAAGQNESIEVRALINWGPQWYITHLGPIPK
ncbi:MAG TPA: hypothetical protein VFO10_13945 [Oligoflexus sp.]|uniref:hypothetical protein n=1 Tax=Oligoflexus sp. TaxID=1971216 RepID=UPI002D7F09A6|nr:hypothetical protein [Oligoflexus sp.]HET9238358.1 hypothetical protein [Oligoflexus sp.]